jgi:hypothetical protein
MRLASNRITSRHLGSDLLAHLLAVIRQAAEVDVVRQLHEVRQRRARRVERRRERVYKASMTQVLQAEAREKATKMAQKREERFQKRLMREYDLPALLGQVGVEAKLVVYFGHDTNLQVLVGLQSIP